MTGLHLTSLTLSHFRSHKSARLDLDARPVAIHGPNGAGKTNILEAVSLFSPGRGLRRAAAQDMARRPESLGWKVTGILHSLHQVHEVDLWSEDGAARQTKIDGKPAAQTALGRIARVLWLVSGKFGSIIRGIRDDEQRVRFLGYRVEVYKHFVFTLTGILCGIAGALYYPQAGIINPDEIAPIASIYLAVWVAIGGRGRLYGAVIGAAVVSLLSTYFTGGRAPDIDLGAFTIEWVDWWPVLLGLGFVMVTLFAPKGLGGLVDYVVRKAPKEDRT